MARSGARDSVRVGVLFSQTGVFAATEMAHLQGTILGIARVNAEGGIAGRPIEPIICNPAGDVAEFKHLAHALLVEAEVTNIFGCCTSTSRKALLPLVERANALLWYPTQFEGFEYSPNVVYGGACPNQHIVPLAEHLALQGRRRMFMVGTDYLYPRESNRVMGEMFAGLGGTVVGERYVPIGAGIESFAEVFAAARAAQADVLFSTVVGLSMIALARAYRTCGLDAAAMPIACIGLGEMEIALGEAELFCGHITTSPYLEAIASADNAAFVLALHARYGDRAHGNSLIASSYAQVGMFARAAAEAGCAEPDRIKAIMPDLSFAAPHGTIRWDAESHCTYLQPRIAVANRAGSFEIVAEASEMVRPDPYLVAYR